MKNEANMSTIKFKRKNVGSKEYPLYVYDDVNEQREELMRTDILAALDTTFYNSGVGSIRIHKEMNKKTWVIKIMLGNGVKFTDWRTGYETLKAAAEAANCQFNPDYWSF